MKTLLFYSFFTLTITLSFAQNKDTTAIDPLTKQRAEAMKLMLQNQNINVKEATTHQFIYSFDTRYEGLKGSYYFIPNWLKGDLYGIGGKVIESNVLLKYDTYNKEVLMKKPNGDTVAVYPSGFTIYDEVVNKSFTFMKYAQIKSRTGVELPNNYMLVMFKGKNILMKNVSKRIEKANYKGAYSAGITYDEFTDNSEYYVIKNNGDVQRFRLKKNAIIDALGEQKQKIEEYIKSNKLNLKDDGDLLKIIVYFDGL